MKFFLYRGLKTQFLCIECDKTPLQLSEWILDMFRRGILKPLWAYILFSFHEYVKIIGKIAKNH